jgi:hypothetical protein
MTTGGTLTFNDGEFVDVSVNGVALVAGTDYNTTTANTIGGLSALSANDQVEIVVYDTFSVFGGNVDGDFNLNNGNMTITTADNTAQLTLKSTDADASSGPEMDLIRESASPADDDELGHISFKGQNDAAETVSYAEIDTFLRDASDGTEDGELRLNVRRNGTLREGLSIGADVVFNEGGEDVDVRMESDGNTSMFFLDAGNNVIGIGTGSPTNPLTVRGTAGTGVNSAIKIIDESDQAATIGIQNDGDLVFVNESTDADMSFSTGGGTSLQIQSDGDVLINDGDLIINTSGHGISFSATANAGNSASMGSELLDDYEEGTWTPTFTTNSGSAASGSVSGRYTKFGRAVCVTANINNITTSGTTGGSILRIDGLPFTCDGLSMHGAVTADNVSFQGSRTQITALFSTGDLVQFPQTGHAAGDTPTDHNDITSGTSDILFSGVYFSDQ